jgi:hypothetical protein
VDLVAPRIIAATFLNPTVFSPVFISIFGTFSFANDQTLPFVDNPLMQRPSLADEH